MKLDVECMPLLVYDQLTVDKTMEAEFMAECCDNVMTGEFSQFEEVKTLMVHDQLKVEITNDVEVMVKCNVSKNTTDQSVPNSVHFLDSLGFGAGCRSTYKLILYYMDGLEL